MGVFADNDTTGTGKKIEAIEKVGTENTNTTSDDLKKEKIKQEISAYIIDSYKAQWDKILKDIEQTLIKTMPEKNDRIEAYDKIQQSLVARREKNKSSTKVSETSKVIIDAFLTHMIDSIEKRKTELSQ